MPEPKTTEATPRKRDRSRSANSRTIQLASGGTITLAGNFNLLAMSEDEVNLVIEMAGLMTKYEQAQADKAKAARQQATTRPAAGPTPVAPTASKPS